MRLLLALGIIGGATWIAYAFVPAECAPPTGDSEVFCNRLWTPALFAMTAGFAGMWRWSATLEWRAISRGLGIVAAGGALMTLGNFLEYWVFFSFSHDGPDGWLRGTLWMMVLLGWLGLLLSAFGAGLLLLLARRSGLRTMVLGAILVTAPCLTVFIGPLAIGVLAIAACLCVLVLAARLPQEPVPELA
jgi:hypothetical protein